MEQINPLQLRTWLDDPSREKPVLLDVRAPWEFNRARSGRSMQVAMFLERQGFKRVHNLLGGIDAWSRTVDPAVPVY